MGLWLSVSEAVVCAKWRGGHGSRTGACVTRSNEALRCPARVDAPTASRHGAWPTLKGLASCASAPPPEPPAGGAHAPYWGCTAAVWVERMMSRYWRRTSKKSAMLQGRMPLRNHGRRVKGWLGTKGGKSAEAGRAPTGASCIQPLHPPCSDRDVHQSLGAAPQGLEVPHAQVQHKGAEALVRCHLWEARGQTRLHGRHRPALEQLGAACCGTQCRLQP